MTGKLIEQGPYAIETPSYDIETGLYERLTTAYVSAPEKLCVPLGRSRGMAYSMSMPVLTRRPRWPGRAFSTTMAGMFIPCWYAR